MLSYSRQEILEEDIQAVVDALRSESLTGGDRLRAFEEAVAEFVGAKYGVAFSSGTAALHAAVSAAEVGPGDEGITTPNTFCATANCLIYQGGRPVFADVAEDTLTLDPAAVQARITPKTKVLLPVDYAGHPADLDAMAALADKHGLTVIEDACHAIGARYRGQRVGSISHMSVFSFHPVKHIAAGEGGMVTTNDSKFAERLRRFRDHGINRSTEQTATEPWFYAMENLGFNYRLDEMSCALGFSQLKRIESNLNARRGWAMRYAEALADFEGLRLPVEQADCDHAWHLYPIRINERIAGIDRRTVFCGMREAGIRVQVHYIPVHRHPYYQSMGWRAGQFPVAEAAYEQILSLPMFHGMQQAEWQSVIDCLTRIWKERRCHA